MKKYSLYDLKVIMVVSSDSTRYLICKYNYFSDTYVEIFTGEKIKDSDISCVELLSDYYSISEEDYTADRPLVLDKKELLKKYIEINTGVSLKTNKHTQNETVGGFEEKKEETNNLISIDSILDEATINFFPKSGEWYSDCFRKPRDLSMNNLPCHLRDDMWLARMLNKYQSLSNISFNKILNYVRTSHFFEQKRHEYELEIVKWQINWMRNGGEGWICDDNYGGDAYLLTPVCDLAFRKGVVDTLSRIGMNRDVVEEGIEKNAILWRESLMKTAFRNEYEPVFFMSKSQVDPAEEEHKEKWLKMRRYEYYQRHKKSVDLYGVATEDMQMSKEEVLEIRQYLEQKHQERMKHIEEVKNARYSNENRIKSL